VFDGTNVITFIAPTQQDGHSETYHSYILDRFAVCQNQLLHSCYAHTRPRYARTTGAIFITAILSTICEISESFYDILHPSYADAFDGGSMLCPYKRHHTTNSARPSS
jgi:hypothetical protein